MRTHVEFLISSGHFLHHIGTARRACHYNNNISCCTAKVTRINVAIYLTENHIRAKAGNREKSPKHFMNQGSHTLRDIIFELKPDICMLQEHWLTPANLSKLDDTQQACLSATVFMLDEPIVVK